MEQKKKKIKKTTRTLIRQEYTMSQFTLDTDKLVQRIQSKYLQYKAALKTQQLILTIWLKCDTGQLQIPNEELICTINARYARLQACLNWQREIIKLCIGQFMNKHVKYWKSCTEKIHFGCSQIEHTTIINNTSKHNLKNFKDSNAQTDVNNTSKICNSKNHSLQRIQNKSNSVNPIAIVNIKHQNYNALSNQNFVTIPDIANGNKNMVIKRHKSDTLLENSYTLPNAEKFKCTKCNKSFKTKKGLSTHYNMHTDKFKCTYCNLRTQSKSELTNHIRCHTGEKPFKCTLQSCTMSFRTQTHLTMHMKSHRNEKPYSCDICNKNFTRKYSLNRHSKIHTGDKPYKCTICNKRFIQKCDLKKHSRIHNK